MCNSQAHGALTVQHEISIFPVNSLPPPANHPPYVQYATFQSHNQRIVSNQNGIFLCHLTDGQPVHYPNAESWRLSQSTDGGNSWNGIAFDAPGDNTIDRACFWGHSPSLETDTFNNLLLVELKPGRPGVPADADASLDFITPRSDQSYRRDFSTTLQGGFSDKQSLLYDERGGRIYYASARYHKSPETLTFYTMDQAGNILSDRPLILATRLGLQNRSRVYANYPQLRLDLDGNLHLSWTSQAEELPPLPDWSSTWTYWSIHHIQSADAGVTWTNMKKEVLSDPIFADDNRADMINLPGELGTHCWLSNFLPKDGKLHFLYTAGYRFSPPRQHYVRYDVQTGKRDIDQFPKFEGESISLSSTWQYGDNVGGFFATRTGAPGSPLFCITSARGQSNILASNLACLRSDDNGETWHDHAIRSADVDATAIIEGIGGCSEITNDDHVIGVFNMSSSPASSTTWGPLIPPAKNPGVFFFKFPIAIT